MEGGDLGRGVGARGLELQRIGVRKSHPDGGHTGVMQEQRLERGARPRDLG